MSALGRRPWGWWNGADMMPLEIQLASLPVFPEPALVRSVAKKRPRGTEDKTGQGTRARIGRRLLEIWGPYCHLCVLWGAGLDAARIDLGLKFPDLECFTRDHIEPRSRGGEKWSIRNQRPAHQRCNTYRGNKSLEEIERTPPEWVRSMIKEAA